MEGLKLDKAQVARRQLGTALALFIEDLDPVSVHTLACAGGELADHLSRKSGAQTFAEHALATFPEIDIKKLRRIERQFWNAFKHATTQGGEERADHELLDRFNDLQNDHTLFVGWYDYQQAEKALPIEAQAFQAWYFALYPDRLSPDVDASSYDKISPDLRDQPRNEQKRALREAIAKVRANQDVMNDPLTEQTPLIAK
jgi:hypothetical protein